MKVEYSNRATADLRKISTDSRVYGESVAAVLEARIRQVVAHIAEHPEAAPRVEARPGVRAFPLIRYPYRIFYRFFLIASAFYIFGIRRGGLGGLVSNPSGRNLRRDIEVAAEPGPDIRKAIEIVLRGFDQFHCIGGGAGFSIHPQHFRRHRQLHLSGLLGDEGCGNRGDVHR
jgi:plasmid stabilization system protein ParE